MADWKWQSWLTQASIDSPCECDLCQVVRNESTDIDELIGAIWILDIALSHTEKLCEHLAQEVLHERAAKN